jgi:hypothetical protein
MSDARIVTNYEYPPIPDRRFDWSAIDENTYDGAEDSHCPIGRGATEREAIDDLLDQICLVRGADADRNNGCRYCTAEPGVACRATVVSALSSQTCASGSPVVVKGTSNHG